MKKILLLLMLIIITGCNAEYTVVVDEKNIDEVLDVYVSEQEYSSMDAETISNALIQFERAYEFYEREDLIESKNKLGYRYKYNNNDYVYYATESQASRCYQTINIVKDKTIRIETSNYVECYDKYPLLNELTIKVKTLNEVIDHNADVVDGNTYIWNIDKENYENKQIVFEISKEKKQSKFPQLILYTSIGLFIILVLGIFYKIKKANEY